MHINNEIRKRYPKFVITTTAIITAVMLLGTTAISTLTTAESVFAYRNNQATSQVNDCGNGELPLNVGCQNTGSQIQGDENVVALAVQQTFTSQEPQTCVDCIFEFLTTEQIALFEEFLTITTNGVITTIEELCELPLEEQLELLNAFAATLVGGTEEIDPSLLAELIDCLESVSGLSPNPVP